ncbi:hypothetical protein MUP29_11890 [bacterium]|nr:hypothetical protein [bacterium]
MAIKRGVTLLLPLLLLNPVLAFARGTDPGGWTRVDSIVATISGAPILETDILMEMDLGLLESSHLGDDFGLLLEAYLNRLLILKEVEEVGGFRLTAGQAEGAYQGYLLRYESKEDYEEKLQMWGIDEEDVFGWLSRALLVSLYTESRIQFFVNILPSDIEKAYEEDQDRWGGATIYEVWESVRSELMQSTYRKERDRWLATLRTRYDLNVYSLNGELGK